MNALKDGFVAARNLVDWEKEGVCIVHLLPWSRYMYQHLVLPDQLLLYESYLLPVVENRHDRVWGALLEIPEISASTGQMRLVAVEFGGFD